jgi:hypothetical protein
MKCSVMKKSREFPFFNIEIAGAALSDNVSFYSLLLHRVRIIQATSETHSKFFECLGQDYRLALRCLSENLAKSSILGLRSRNVDSKLEKGRVIFYKYRGSPEDRRYVS